MTSQPTLFDQPPEPPPGICEQPPGIEAGMAALEQTSSRAKNAEMIEALVPIAQRLAQDHPDGITVAQLRKLAVGLNILTGYEKGSQLSYLGSVMKAAGLVSTGQMIRSKLTASHGRHHVVWVKP